MDREYIKAHLNLHAVFVNLEDLVLYDEETAAIVKNWNVSLQFIVRNGPRAYVAIQDGRCTVGRGRYAKPSVVLYFFSPAHLNKMFDGKANPVILKGFTRLGFLLKDFPKLTKRLEYYLKPTPELLKNSAYLALNTRFTLTTAVFAIGELGKYDDACKNATSHMRDGVALMKVLPGGPAAHLEFSHGAVVARKGDAEKPMSAIFFKNIKVASEVLNQKLDSFTGVASGLIMPRGQIGMIESIDMMLDRVPAYLG